MEQTFIKYSKNWMKILDDLVSQINDLKPDLILICANSIDSANSLFNI